MSSLLAYLVLYKKRGGPEINPTFAALYEYAVHRSLQ
jgi:hypothetical protein